MLILLVGVYSGMDEVSTETKSSKASSDLVSDENGDWEASLRANWKPFSLNPWRLFLDCRAAKIVTVEPIVFLYMFNTYLLSFTLQQYFFWRFGKEQLANSSFPDLNRSSFCISTDDLDDYGRTNETADNVQASAGHLVTYTFLPGLLVSVIVALVLGPLSDKYGRRLIFFSIATGVLVQGVLTFFIMWFNLNMYLFILGATLPSFFGGFASCLTASFSYAADISSGRCRTIRIALIEAMIFLGGALSEGTAGVLLRRLNCTFWPLLVIYITCGVLMIVYAIFILPESLSKFERLQKTSHHRRGVRALARGLKIFLCPSEYSTWKLWFGVVVISIMVSNFIGSQEITAFFLIGEPLKWHVDLIGYYDVVTQVTHGLVLIVIAPILVALSLPDAVIALIGLVFSSGMNIFMGFVKETWEMFVGKPPSLYILLLLSDSSLPLLSSILLLFTVILFLPVVATLAGMESMIVPSVRSFLSKEVSAGDQGMGASRSQVHSSNNCDLYYPCRFLFLCCGLC